MNLFHKDDMMKKAEAAKMLSAMMPKWALKEAQEHLFLEICWDIEQRCRSFLKTSEMTDLWLDSKESIKDCVDRIAKKVLSVQDKRKKSDTKFILNVLPLVQKIIFEVIESKGGE